MNEISIGKIVKPQGILGEIKILSYLEDTEVFCILEEIRFAKEKEYRKIEKIRASQEFVFAKVEGINLREDAELLRHVEVFADKEKVRKLIGDENAVFFEDMVGMKLVGEKELGIIVSIDNMGAGDVITAKQNGKELMAPVIDGLIEKIDEQNKVVYVNDKIFNEVVLKQYEN